MKHLPLARRLPWLLIAVCPPLLGHCGGAVEHGTETGNPPVVEQQKLHVVLHEDGVEVLGEPGAVPAGATVTVRNVRSSDQGAAIADAGGSVSVSVPGTLADEYEVTVSHDGRSQTVRVSSVGSSATSTGGLDAASCDSLEQTLRNQVVAEYTAASKACQTDSDCTTGSDVGCYYTCGGPIVSVAGMQAAQRALLESTATVCAELSQRCGPRGPPGCPALAFSNLACNEGICGQLSCSDFSSRIGSQISDLVGDARDCERDEDCSYIAFKVRCVASCGTNHASVRTDRSDQVTTDIQSLEQRYCAEFEQRCPPDQQPPCNRPANTPETSPRAVCIANKCDVAAVPLP